MLDGANPLDMTDLLATIPKRLWLELSQWECSTLRCTFYLRFRAPVAAQEPMTLLDLAIGFWKQSHVLFFITRFTSPLLTPGHDLYSHDEVNSLFVLVSGAFLMNHRTMNSNMPQLLQRTSVHKICTRQKINNTS